jgi:SAM-dependent methyltransferase
MWILRKFVTSCLPAWWRDRIDLEGRGIKQMVAVAAEEIPAGSLLLDAGAGQMPYREMLPDVRYVGIDFGVGDKAWDYSNLDVVGRLESLPFGTGTFDAVLSTQVLEHVPEPGFVLDEMFRVLKPGGTLYLTAPLGFGEHQQPHDYFRYTQFGLRHLLKKTGFDLRSIEPRGGFFWYMAVMSMWFYLYLFPEKRHLFWKIALSPLQLIAALCFVLIGPPILSVFDFFDHDKVITLGYAVTAGKPVKENALD